MTSDILLRFISYHLFGDPTHALQELRFSGTSVPSVAYQHLTRVFVVYDRKSRVTQPFVAKPL